MAYGRRLSLFAIAFLLAVSSCYAAMVHGVIYDDSLKQIDNVRLEINTLPQQTLISKDGTYSFNVPAGNYLLKAEKPENNLMGEESIAIADEGDFTIDIILFEQTADEEELMQNGIEVGDLGLETQTPAAYLYLIIALLAIALAIAIFWKVIRRRPTCAEETDAGLDSLLEVIKNNDGRITQKGLRKNFPLSEAKISLMLTELEHKGKVERIKKGRGNIIILKK